MTSSLLSQELKIRCEMRENQARVEAMRFLFRCSKRRIDPVSFKGFPFAAITRNRARKVIALNF